MKKSKVLVQIAICLVALAVAVPVVKHLTRTFGSVLKLSAEDFTAVSVSPMVSYLDDDPSNETWMASTDPTVIKKVYSIVFNTRIKNDDEIPAGGSKWYITFTDTSGHEHKIRFYDNSTLLYSDNLYAVRSQELARRRYRDLHGEIIEAMTAEER